MISTKFTEFIIKYKDFYNCLSEINRELISNLDEYGDLSIYEIEDVFDYNTYLYIESTISDCNKYLYLYIGKKKERKYFCKCAYEYNNELVGFNIKESSIIFIDNWNLCKNIKYTYF